MRKKIIRNGFATAVIIFYALIVIGIMNMCSCTTTRTVTVPEIHKEVVHQHDTLALKDSVFVHDSVTVEIVRGDTTYLYTTRWRTEYRDRWRDRIVDNSLVRTDSITQVVEVEKPPNFWQRHRLSIGSWLLSLVLLTFIILYYYRRFRP